MNLNPNIILGGQQPDVVNTLARSTRAAGLANQVQKDNALNQLYQQHGQGLMSGDPNAINALAAQDPRQAFQFQQGHRDNARQDQMDEMQRQKFDMAVQDFARRASAEERAAAAAELERDITRAGTFYQSGDLEGLNRALVAAGEEPVQSLDQFPVIAGLYGDALSVLKSAEALTAEDKPADAYERYVQRELAAGREPMNEFDYADALRGNGVTVTSADGSSVRVGGRVKDTKFTESQGKDNVYSTRARGALEALEPVAGSLTSRTNRAAELDPTGLAREFQSDDFQVAQQAGLEFLQAILRKDTGAAITQDETESYGKTYLPQPGDGPAVLEAKRVARIRAINALESGMTSSQMLARDRALIKAAGESGTETPAAVQAHEPQADPSFDFQDGEQRQIFEKYR